jgi:hypothetical protein
VARDPLYRRPTAGELTVSAIKQTFSSVAIPAMKVGSRGNS